MSLFKFDGFIFTDEFDPAFPGYKKKGTTKEYVPLHNYIYWQHTGLIPRKGKTAIHHIDGNRENNEIENLELLTTLQHRKVHPNKPKIMSICKRGKGLFGFSGATYSYKHIKPWNKVWECAISYNNKRKFLGYFNDPLSCEIVHDLIHIEIH